MANMYNTVLNMLKRLRLGIDPAFVRKHLIFPWQCRMVCRMVVSFVAMGEWFFGKRHSWIMMISAKKKNRSAPDVRALLFVTSPGVEPGPKEPESLILSIRLRGRGGAGGSRTLVQTWNNHAFYILIPLLLFVAGKGANALSRPLSP